MSFSFPFHPNRQILMLGGFIFILILIPVGSLVLSQKLKVDAPPAPKPVTRTIDTTKTVTTEKKPTNLDSIKDLSATLANDSASSSGSVVNLSLGPTLNFTLALEGRAKTDQGAKVFVGIASGNPVASPQYLLSFTVDLPSSGTFKGLSLAGLNIGSQYTAYIKGPSHIASSSAFLLNPNETTLNSGEAITLLAGDLNEDNQVTSSDYQIVVGLFSTTPKSTNWNTRADINNDEVVNSADLAYVIKNLGKSGTSGTWISTPTASSSAQRQTGIGGESSGYWLWVPTF